MRRLLIALAFAAAPPAAAQDGPPRPFTVAIPDAAVEDLRTRLKMTRWPDQIADSGWTYGADTAYLRGLIEYWADGYDWRAQEARINGFDNFTAEVDGITLHFIHQRSADPDAIPLLILHGWPSSFVQFLDIIPMLTDPAAHGADGAQAFHVVAASLPGYGFSEIPGEAGFAIQDIAARMHGLMTRTLGYERYAIRGSDIGKSVAQQMSIDALGSIIGLHLTGALRGSAATFPEPQSEEIRTYLADNAAWNNTELAYARLHATKPQTIGAALNDSPAGLAAWIVEKFESWGDTRDGLETAFSRDDLLTNLSVYWFTQTINPSMRLYYEFSQKGLASGAGDGVPVAYQMALHDQVPAPREAVEADFDLSRWSVAERGGHFLEQEEPELVAADMRAFFAGLR